MASMKRWRMPAPAPWARTYSSQASGGRSRMPGTLPMVGPASIWMSSMVTPSSAYFISACSLPSAAARSGTTSSTSTSGSALSFLNRSGAVLMVCFLMSSRLFTSRHARGIDTGAPGSGRTLNGATSSLPDPFWR